MILLHFCPILTKAIPRQPTMSRLKLIQTLNSLSRDEFRLFLKVVDSPAFNRHKKLILLAKLLREKYPSFGDDTTLKKEAFAHLFPGETYNDLRIRHLFSQMTELAETSLALAVWKDSEKRDLEVARELGQRQMSKSFRKAMDRVENKLTQSTNEGISLEHYYQRYQFQELRQLAPRENWGESPPDLSLDHYYLLNKLRHACIALSRRRLNQIGTLPAFLPEAKQILSQMDDPPPLIQLYNAALAFMESATALEPFQNFLGLLQQQQTLLSRPTGAELHVLARNFCIRRMNAGDKVFARRLYDLYQIALEGKYVHDTNGHIFPAAFKNIVSVGIRLGDYAGVEDFLEAHHEQLEDRFRPDYLLYAKSLLEFAGYQFQKVVHLLRNARYSSAFLELDCRILLCKTWYELEEFEVCLSLVESTEKLLKRRDLKTYHRNHYGFILKLLRSLLYVPQLNEQNLRVLQAEVQREDLPDGAWFRSKLGISDVQGEKTPS